MIKITIIEDEALASRNIERMLIEIAFDIEIIAKIESVADAIKILPNIVTDLILMDIHLADGSAFQIFESIEIDIPIIFTTAFDQYTLKAFKQNSIDYLLKPIDKTELEQAIQKFQKLFLVEQKTPDFQYESLKKLFSANRTHKKRFLVKLGKKMKPIPTAEIAYFFVKDKAVYIQSFGKKIYLIDESLSQLEEQLNPDSFYRLNRQYIVNNEAITDIYYLSTTRLKVNLNPPSESDVLVTIDRIMKFKKWLNQ